MMCKRHDEQKSEDRLATSNLWLNLLQEEEERHYYDHQPGFHCQSQDHDKEMCLHVNQEDIWRYNGPFL